jgi:ATP-binding cassette subfamily G (WHITE) protein 2 (SNQ2)
MVEPDRPTPHVESLPGGWTDTPVEPNRQSYIGNTQQPNAASSDTTTPQHGLSNTGTYLDYSGVEQGGSATPARYSTASGSTVVLSRDGKDADAPIEPEREEEVETRRHSVDTSDNESEAAAGFASIKPATEAPTRPTLQPRTSKPITEDDLFRALSRRRTNTLSRTQTQATATSDDDEQEEINKLMSRMFGRTRQANSDEEKTRHQGVIFKNLTVKGMGAGAALQPSVGDMFMNGPRFIKRLISRGPRRAAGKPPVRTIIDDFSGCIKPGEMLLVLGRPGAGCSTFLKVIGNQRFGYEEITGNVSYGGTDAKEMSRKFRSEVLYNPEDDMHYATLKVKDTLRFALKTKTPGKASRNEGETRQDYVSEFLRVVSKLFWIEHTMGTKVGNEFVRGVSGGEKKRVSIAEAMITKVSALIRIASKFIRLVIVEASREVAKLTDCRLLYKHGITRLAV